MSAPSQTDPSSYQGNVKGAGRPDAFAEVAQLDTGEVLDQTEDVGAARRQRPPSVVLAEPVE